MCLFALLLLLCVVTDECVRIAGAAVVAVMRGVGIHVCVMCVVVGDVGVVVVV